MISGSQKTKLSMALTDQTIRLAAFEWLAEQVRIYGEVLPRKLLERGFTFESETITLVGPQGIWKPRHLSEIPLSITTAPDGPYDDAFSPDGLLRYKYRGTDPTHPDNAGLRKAMQRRVPLIYFHGIMPGKYLANWPVYIVGDSQDGLTFSVAVDDMSFVRIAPGDQPLQEHDETLASCRRAYVTTIARRRLHQQRFREKVIDAYRTQCACCRLRHGQLLDAAHIIADSDPDGIPSINNGISLCKLHHAAFDAFIIGISPEYVITVRKDILEEEDGPMLLHGLQGMNGRQIIVPRSEVMKPDRGLLDRRYEQFRRAG